MSFKIVCEDSVLKNKLCILLHKKVKDVNFDIVCKMSTTCSDKEIYEYISKHVKKDHRSDKRWGQYNLKSAKQRALSRYKDIRPYIKEKPEVYVDFGAGDCIITEVISGKIKANKTYAIDIPCCSKIDTAPEDKPHESIELEVGVNEPFPLENNTVDLITCFQSLHHTKDLKMKLQEMSRIMKPGGILIIREHNLTDKNLEYLIEIEHFIYDIVLMKMSYEDAVQDYKGTQLLSRNKWNEYIKSYEFENIYTFEPPYMKKNPTESYYAVYKKNKSYYKHIG